MLSDAGSVMAQYLRAKMSSSLCAAHVLDMHQVLSAPSFKLALSFTMPVGMARNLDVGSTAHQCRKKHTFTGISEPCLLSMLLVESLT